MMNVSEQDAADDDDVEVEKTVTSHQMTSSTSLDNLQVSIIYLLLLANVYFRDARNCLERQLFKDNTSCFVVPFAVIISRLYVYSFHLCTVAFCEPNFTH